MREVIMFAMLAVLVVSLLFFGGGAVVFAGATEACSGSISKSEYDGLEDLYVATNGKLWDWNYSDPNSVWSFPSSLSKPCSGWHGITCIAIDDVSCSIVSLELIVFRLIGSIPSEIAYLSLLTELFLEGNELIHSIPSEIASITGLTNLSLSHNKLTGQMPSELGGLSALVYLDLVGNFLEGTIPIQFYQFASIQQLYLGSNLLEGSLLSSIGNLTSLTVFSIIKARMTGTIPPIVSSLPNLRGILLEQNLMEGSISSELFGIAPLVNLILQENLFTGAIWPEITSVNLETLALCCNSLTGSLPTSVGLLTALTELNIEGNMITGSIPSELCQMTLMSTLYLQDNHLSQSIPNCINFLVNLDVAIFSNNLLTGRLSANFSSCTQLTDLYVNGNFLTNTLPSAMSSLQLILYYSLTSNYFSGVVPPEYANLLQLILFDCSGNLLVGSLPDIFGSMSSMQQIYLGNNQFTGPLLTNFGNYSTIQMMDVSVNHLEGPVPAEWAAMVELDSLYVADNFLTGSLDRLWWSNWTVLETAVMDGNLFSGSIAGQFGTMRRLKSAVFDSNYVSGYIPPGIGSSGSLEYLSMTVNYISGQLPIQLAGMSHLEVLNGSFNLISGSMDYLFEDNTSLPRLNFLALADNSITGALPSQLFENNPLRRRLLDTVIMYSNCLSSSIPDSVCSSENLTTLVLDSMSAAPSCTKPFGPFLSSVFKVSVSSISQKGSIPTCIWDMPQLKTLHLAGNGFQGTLGYIDHLTSQLDDIGLSSNRLTGSIPLSWQTYGKFVQLDLSSNKLSGTLDGNFNISALNTNLDLSVNRLSGRIPAAFALAANISILEGNLFQCEAASMPENDPNSSDYVCGSDDFDISLMVLGSVGVAFAFVWIVSGEKIRKAIAKAYSELCAVRNKPDAAPYDRVCVVIAWGARWSMVMCGLYVSVAMVLYVVFKVIDVDEGRYSTHAVQYAWTSTVAFTHGIAPTVTVLIILILSNILLSVVVIPKSLEKEPHSDADTLPTDMHRFHLPHCSNYLTLTAVLVVHMVVTIVTNVAYVYALIKGLDATLLVLVQIVLSLFKLTWNTVYVPKCLQHLSLGDKTYLLCRCFMVLFTFVVSPLIATFFIDTSCFRYVVDGQPEVTSTFTTSVFSCDYYCYDTDNDSVLCEEICFLDRGALHPESSSVAPSWLYSYQCSSAYLVNYSPVLLFAYSTSGFVVPILQILTVCCYDRAPEMLRRVLLGRLRASNYVGEEAALQCTRGASYSVICRLALNIAVMLTFCLACPLLSIAVCVDTWAMSITWSSTISAANRILLQVGNEVKVSVDVSVDRETGRICSKRLVSDGPLIVSEPGRVCKQILDHCSFRGILAGVGPCFSVALVFVTLFWCFFLFDMMADVYGSEIGGAIIGVCVAAVLFSFCLRGLIRRCVPFNCWASKNAVMSNGQFDSSLNEKF
jgi:Leucine-rich repeat (LRR) protein